MSNTGEMTLEQLTAMFKKVHTIEAVVDGRTVEGYYRSPDYEARKAVMKIMVNATDNMDGIIAAGEFLLIACYVGGFNFAQDDEVKLTAAMTIVEIVEQNNTATLKKS